MDIVKLKDELERLVRIMEVLRGPDGCPWDRKQDYYSLQPYIIEEAYEVVEALLKKDLRLLKEELGDLLLQVIFQSQIARERGDFDLTEVFKTISDKLIRRHPHVFQDKEINSVAEVKATWEAIKREEKVNLGQEIPASIMDNLSRRQPALIQAYEIQARAAEVGFDWDNAGDIINKIEEELSEVKEAVDKNNREEIKGESGDLLFAVVNLIRFYNLNPELTLFQTVLKFKKRFQYIESRVRDKGDNLNDLTLKELDLYWEESKTRMEGE
jgi:tetrapyrrole methylase family protein / MazG family protein